MLSLVSCQLRTRRKRFDRLSQLCFGTAAWFRSVQLALSCCMFPDFCALFQNAETCASQASLQPRLPFASPLLISFLKLYESVQAVVLRSLFNQTTLIIRDPESIGSASGAGSANATRVAGEARKIVRAKRNVVKSDAPTTVFEPPPPAPAGFAFAPAASAVAMPADAFGGHGVVVGDKKVGGFQFFGVPPPVRRVFEIVTVPLLVG